MSINPVAGIEKYRQRSSGDIDVFSPEEVLAVVRPAESEQDAAIYMTARSRAFGAVSCSRCTGVTWTSRVRPSLDGSALRRRYTATLRRAGLRPLRFHDVRHTFGTRMIAKADIRRVQEWMGHADVQTTLKYLHYVPRDDDAALVAEAFRSETVEGQPRVRGSRGSSPRGAPGVREPIHKGLSERFIAGAGPGRAG